MRTPKASTELPLICYLFLAICSESARLNYIFSFWGMIDLLSAIPIIFFARYGPSPDLPAFMIEGENLSNFSKDGVDHSLEFCNL